MKNRDRNVVIVGGAKRGAVPPPRTVSAPSESIPESASPFSVPCFTPGVRLASRSGPVPVEALRAGDMLLTRDNGFQPVLWVGRSCFDVSGSKSASQLHPVLIKAGSLGQGVPEADLLVSPDHKILLTSKMLGAPLAAHEVLVPARHLLVRSGVVTAPQRALVFVHVLMERHEILLSEGLWSESYRPDASLVRMMPGDVQSELGAGRRLQLPSGPVFKPARESFDGKL